MVTIHQTDRDAAADLHIADCGEPLSPYDRKIEEDYRSGKNDDWNDVKAFAARREAERARIVDGLHRQVFTDAWSDRGETLDLIADAIERGEI